MSEIPNKELTIDQIPLPEAGWDEIGWFALTFNGYEYWGGFGPCGDVATKCREAYFAGDGLSENLFVLRSSLFFEQRRWRHYGYNPDEAGMDYICALVVAIRLKVQAGEID